jgi:hypothetical protein
MPVVGNTIESLQLAFTTGGAAAIDFRTPSQGLVRRVTLASDNDVYINFDADATSANFILQLGCSMTLDDTQFTKLSALGVNSSGTLYVLACRG